MHSWRSTPCRDLGFKYDKAVECLSQGSRCAARLVRLPGRALAASAHDQPIESSFATVRHRTVPSKGCVSNKTTLAMIFKLAEAAEKSWRRLDRLNQLPKKFSV